MIIAAFAVWAALGVMGISWILSRDRSVGRA